MAARRLVVPVMLTAALFAGCAPTGDEAPAASSVIVAQPQALAHADLRRTVTIAHEKFRSLAEAMPEGTYEWSPMDGVRSVGDVYQHVAADNFFVPALMGVEAPEQTGVTSDVQTFRDYQVRDMTKDEIVAAVDESFDFLLAAMDETGSDLGREVTLGGSPTTVGDVWIRAVVHLHEHLGQAIAYARSNEVVPPWST